jgi:hypothetical protein
MWLCMGGWGIRRQEDFLRMGLRGWGLSRCWVDMGEWYEWKERLLEVTETNDRLMSEQ